MPTADTHSRRGSRAYAMYAPAEDTVSRTTSVAGAKSIHSVAQSQGKLELDLDGTSHPQLTVKGFLSGILAGIVCSFIALYYGLKVGITPSLNILGGGLGFAICKALTKLPFFNEPFTPQENAVIQTVAVAVYFTASPAFGFANGWLGMSYEAYEVIGGETFPGNHAWDVVDINWWRSTCWCLCLFAFGFFLCFPLKNYYICKKKLLFPSGTATAYIIQTLHARSKETADAVSYLLKFFSVGFLVNIVTWLFNGLSAFPILGPEAGEFGWVLDWDLGTFAIGMLLSKNTNISMLVGALCVYAVIQPYVVAYKDGDFDGAWLNSATLTSDYVGIYAYALFAGLGVMITQGVWGILTLIYTIVSEKIREKRGDIQEGIEEELSDPDLAKRNEIFLNANLPKWVPFVGFAVFAAVCVIGLYFMLGVQWYFTLVALLIMPVFAISNIEGLGRTDWDVASSYGKLAMFPIGALNHSIIPALAVCHATISGVSNSAILMQDFKTGYLLGSSPTVMFIAQFFGALVGCIVTPSLFILLRSAFPIPTDEESAFIQGRFGPVYRTLAVVATGAGFDSLPKNTLWICLTFILIALALDVLGLVLPEKWTKWLPDPSAMSIGMLVGATVPVEFLVGGLLGEWWKWWRPEAAQRNRAYVASGMLAGSGVAVVFEALMALAGLSSPMTVSFAKGWTETPPVGGIVFGAIVLVLAVAVVCMALWFWWPATRFETFEEHAPLAAAGDEAAAAADENKRQRQESTSSSASS